MGLCGRRLRLGPGAASSGVLGISPELQSAAPRGLDRSAEGWQASAMQLNTPDTITAAFTRPEGFRFARWAQPIAPMIYGLDPASTNLMKAGLHLICDLTNHPYEDTDPVAGYNHVTLHCADWAELRDVPPLGPGIDNAKLAEELTERDLPRHLVFWFDDQGAIIRALHLVRVDHALAELPADLLAIIHAMMAHLHWGPSAFESGTTQDGPHGAQIRADLLDLLRAAYDRSIPAASSDPSLALRLAARLQIGRGD